MVSIALLGDIAVCGGNVSVGDDLKSFCAQTDLVIANLEGPLVNVAKSSKVRGVPLFNGKGTIQLLRDLNVKGVTLGNNHIMDYGVEGLEDTIKALDNTGILWAGVRQNSEDSKSGAAMVFEHERVVVLSFAHREGPVAVPQGRGVGPYVLPKRAYLSEEINRWRDSGYEILIAYHGGEEYHKYPWPRRLGFYNSLVTLGARIVFGHHSHSIQPVYRLKGDRLICPGLGNVFLEIPGQAVNTRDGEGLVLSYNSDGEARACVINSSLTKRRLDWSVRSIVIGEEFEQKNMISGWVRECRQSIVGFGPNSPRSTIARWRKIVRPPWVIIKFLARSVVSIRDRDRLLSSLPLIGPMYARRLLKYGYHHFDF